jgi:tRNA (guanine37-N1)-methyltransferase
MFPHLFETWLATSILKRAIDHNLVDIDLYNMRDFAQDKHHTLDDYPYGGGAGMVLKPEPIFKAIEAIKDKSPKNELPIILLTPQGRLLTQSIVSELSLLQNITLICGRYEGIDERVRQYLVNDEISVGDYILSGGELAAMIIIESVTRLLPGVLGSAESKLNDSHITGLLGYPQYTRPATFQGWSVPKILRSGDHNQIAYWRREQAILRTMKRRPDLLDKVELKPNEVQLLKKLKGD